MPEAGVGEHPLVNGKPDDGDGRESGAEQCGKLQPDGQWDDASCTQDNHFLCERP